MTTQQPIVASVSHKLDRMVSMISVGKLNKNANDLIISLEPYLGFLHSEAWGKPSLVCDFMELYRYLVEDFLVQNSANFKKKDFIMEHEDYSKNKAGKREYLNNSATNDLTRKLYSYFESTVEVERMRHGKRQTVETLINEEAFLLAQYLRDESETWTPRMPSLI